MKSAEDDDGREEADATIRDILRMLAVTGPAVAETASQIYLAAKGRMPFGYSRQIRAAAVYASCRLFGVPRTLKEVAFVCDLDFIPLAACYRKVVEDAGLIIPVQDPVSYVSGIASRAGLDAPTERRSIEIISAAKRLRTTEGKAPTAVAAAALYMAYMELHPRVTQLDIAEAAGITEVTLRNRLRTIRRAAEKQPSETDGE